MTASFPTSVKTFSNKVDGTSPIEASHINDLQSEIVAVETAILTHSYVTVTTFYNSWTNYGGGWDSASYLKDVFGYVHLRGLIANGTIGDVDAFILPAGYRPAYRVLFTVDAATGSHVIGRVDVTSSGQVRVVAGGSGYTSLNSVVFLAEG